MGVFTKEQIIDLTKNICLLNMRKQKAIKVGKFANRF